MALTLPVVFAEVNEFMKIFCIECKILAYKGAFSYNVRMSKKSPKPERTSLKWRVRVVMAERDVRSVSELVRMLETVGVSISVAQLGRLIDGKTQHWNQDVIEGLMFVLDCELAELLVRA